jgi:hypothetical protein
MRAVAFVSLVDYYLKLGQRKMRSKLLENWPWIFTGLLATLTFAVFISFLIYLINYQGDQNVSYRWQ